MDSVVPRRNLRADTVEILGIVQAALLDKKALDITILDIGAVSSLADAFVFASGTSTRHIDTLVDAVRDAVRAHGIRPYGIEGKSTGWCLIDLGDIVVHIFDQETRSYYDLERLWMDAPKVDEEELLDQAVS